MVVCDIFHRQTTVDDLDGLRAVLAQRREDGANCFWLAHDGRTYPHLALLVRGELASVHYFPEDRDAGYVPVGNLAGLPAGEVTTFSISEHQADDVVVVSDAVVPVPLAVRLVEKFFQSDSLPGGVGWMHL